LCQHTSSQLPSVLTAATRTIGAEISLIVEGMAGGICEESGLLGYDFMCIGIELLIFQGGLLLASLG